MAMVRKTMEEILETMKPERRAMELKRMKNTPFVYDPECPPQTGEQLKQFKRAVPHKTMK